MDNKKLEEIEKILAVLNSESDAEAPFKLPEYVWLHNSALKKKGREYYRMAGAWGVKFKIVVDKLYSISDMEHLNNKELIPCTKEEYEKDNKGYV